MSDKPQYSPGTLLINITTNEQVCNISLDIPAQVIKLIGYRVELTATSDSLSEKVLYLDIPRIMNINRVIDTSPGYTYFPILLDNSKVTMVQGMMQPLTMTHHLPEKFTVRLLNGSFQPVSNLVAASFMFELSYGHSN